jgi:hypothetical protein
MNPLPIYTDAGRKAGLAAKRLDMATLRHWNTWFTRALALEDPDRRQTCRETYNDAYREEAAPR